MISFANIAKNNTSNIAFGVKEIGPYYWIGNCKNGISYAAGQTFRAPETGFLKSIQLFSARVFGDANTSLSIYQFDDIDFTFKTKQFEVNQVVTKQQENEWLHFNLADLPVDKNMFYAFKITCSSGMLAIAECPWTIQDPYADGMQWTASSLSPEGTFHEDFDFSFEGEIETLPDTEFVEHYF